MLISIVIPCYYSEKTFNELDVDDIQINIDDSENGLVYCFELQQAVGG